MVEAHESRSVLEHLARVLELLTPVPARNVPLAAAHGCVLANDVWAAADVPGFATSAMDGYAVRSQDVAAADPTTPVVLDVITELPAGSDADPRLGAGEAARIMTGAPVPTTADAIVPVEHTDDGRVRVAVHRRAAAGVFVRPAGSDVSRGVQVLAAGRMLTARAVAAAAAAGAGTLAVIPRPRVGIVSTGDELVAPGGALRRGAIHDANGPLLAALVTEAGGVPVVLPPVPDEEAAFSSLLDRIDGDLDLLLTSGGVSVGDHDVVKSVLGSRAEAHFGPVRIQPGKPQGYARLPRGTAVITLPGNPVSVFVSFELFGRPALDVLAGRTDAAAALKAAREPGQQVTAGADWRSPADRCQYMPIRFDDQGRVVPATSGGSASHLIASLARADGLAVVAEDVTEVTSGDTVGLRVLRGGIDQLVAG